MKKYIEFLNEKRKHKLTVKDSSELNDFLNHVLNNMEEEPNLLRAAYARIQHILSEIKQGNFTVPGLAFIFSSLYHFIEGGRNVDALRTWGEKLLSIDIENYDILLQIIHEYNYLLNKYKNKFDNQIPNIKSWAFELEGIEPVTESIESDNRGIILNLKTDKNGDYIMHTSFVVKDIDYPVGEPYVIHEPDGEDGNYKTEWQIANKLYDDVKGIIHGQKGFNLSDLLLKVSKNIGFKSQKDYGDLVENVIKFKDENQIEHFLDLIAGIEPVVESNDIQDLFMSGNLSWDEQQELKTQLPTKKLSELEYDDREWNPGDILLDNDTHYLIVENYEDYCDFGCGHIATYLAENPDIDEDEFGEYVCQHNKADRDMGELQDVCEEEIERLGNEFKKEKK